MQRCCYRCGYGPTFPNGPRNPKRKGALARLDDQAHERCSMPKECKQSLTLVSLLVWIMSKNVNIILIWNICGGLCRYQWVSERCGLTLVVYEKKSSHVEQKNISERQFVLLYLVACQFIVSFKFTKSKN